MYLLENMQQCRLECRIWGECTHYTNGMSQQCLVMISISKQEKHYINKNFFIGFIALSCIHVICIKIKSNDELYEIKCVSTEFLTSLAIHEYIYLIKI